MPQTLNRIAHPFGIDQAMLYADPVEFKSFVDEDFLRVLDNLRASDKLRHFVSLTLAGSQDAAEFLGVYERYHFSSIYPGSILRSVFCLYMNGGFLQHYYVERFPGHEKGSNSDCIFKYHGFAFLLEDRLFTLDVASLEANEMTFGNYARVPRNPTRFVFGLTSGIAATMYRQPYSTRVALHKVGSGLITRKHITRCTVLDADDPSVPREIAKFLDDGQDMLIIR